MSNESIPIIDDAPAFSVVVKKDKRKKFFNRATSAQISVKDFFDFMKTAYQVNDSIEQLVPELLIDQPKGLDWNNLANNELVNQFMETSEAKGDDTQLPIKIETECQTEGKFPQEGGHGEGTVEDMHGYDKTTKQQKAKRDSSAVNQEVALHTTQISNAIKEKLNEVLNEGLLDSVLAYLVPALGVNITNQHHHQPVIKKHHKREHHVPTGGKADKVASSTSIFSSASSKSSGSRRRDDGSTSSSKTTVVAEPEVEIHVCDEVKHMKKDFRCPQQLLVSKMGYFAKVTAGQKLEDMDISVHCDIGIFDWLMRWVKIETILPEDQPILDPACVVPVLVSAAFLQMDPLMEDCLRFSHEHMNEIVKTSTNLACLNDNIITRLASMYTNSELEGIRDRKDKILSRLYCKLILSLGEPMPQALRGHWASLAGIFRCAKCGKLVSAHEGTEIPCVPSCMLVDQRGEIISEHVRDMSWNLSDYIVQMYRELKTWRRVYWRLWSTCHFLRCVECLTLFPAHQMAWCCRHPEQPQFFTTEGQHSTAIPIGRYPCCGGRTYRFEVLTNTSQGCQFKEHVPDVQNPRDLAILTLFNQHRNIIEQPPPQIMIPERLTKLVARDAAGECGLFTNREVFWWEGIELAPSRQKLGLLGKMCFVGRANPTRDIRSSTSSSSTEYSSEEELEEPESIQSSDSEGKDSVNDETLVLKQYSSQHHKKKKGEKIGIAGRQWSASLSARSNQDLQRDFEENAMQQITDFLSRRTTGASDSTAVYQRSSTAHKSQLTSMWSHHITPTGGIYQRLEAEWCEIHRQPLYSHPSRNQRASFSYIVKPKFRVHRPDK